MKKTDKKVKAPKEKVVKEKVVKLPPNKTTCLIESYYQVQEHRIAMGNQIFALEAAKRDVEPLDEYHVDLEVLENKIAKHLAQTVKDHVMWPWLKSVKGIGPVFASVLTTSIDIRKADHASSVWKYAGLAPGQKKEKGKKIDFNPFLKVTCWKIGMSFIKTKGEYRGIYDTSKEFYQRKFPKEVDSGRKSKEGKPIMMYTKGHIDAMARRRTVKLFLSHFWAEWRAKEGLTVSVPFQHRGL